MGSDHPTGAPTACAIVGCENPPRPQSHTRTILRRLDLRRDRWSRCRPAWQALDDRIYYDPTRRSHAAAPRPRSRTDEGAGASCPAGRQGRPLPFAGIGHHACGAGTLAAGRGWRTTRSTRTSASSSPAAAGLWSSSETATVGARRSPGAAGLATSTPSEPGRRSSSRRFPT